VTSQQVVDRMRKALGKGLRAVEPPASPDTIHLTVDKAAVVPASRYLQDTLGARFLISAGIDRRQREGCFRVTYIFSRDKDKQFVCLRADVPENGGEITSITPVVPAANWSERECRDLVGVRAEGHPDPRRLVLADDWPEGLHPLRKDVPYNARPAPAVGAAPVPKEAPEGASTVIVGPFYPVLEEPTQVRLFVDGERIVGCDYRGFYNHRGIEKLGDSVLTYNEIPFVAERICGICGFIHSSCYCETAEQAAGIEAPRRARYIRSIMLEIERIHSHLLWVGIAGHILGFDTVLMQVWRIREPIMWLCEKITGNRKTYGMNLIGGVRWDIPADVHPEIVSVVDKIEAECLAVADAIQGDTTLMARLEGVGVLTEEQARRLCVVGPTARGSNVDIDARADHPYAAYDELPPKVITHPGGDTLARVLVRIEEVFEAIRLVREGLKTMPDGPIMAEFSGEIPAERQGVRTVEAPRGEAIHYLITGEDNRPDRWRVRAPTYQNLQALPIMIQGETIADVPIILGSMDPCFSCTERMETIDMRTGRTDVIGGEELLRLSQQHWRGGRR
jgi:Ni,Fe-hydrogenase III large subunit/Ni,Fe-hydrogenase III component G